METKATVTALTGWKVTFWMGLGEAIAFLTQNITVLHLPAKYEGLVPFIGIGLGIVGKMIASYVATQE